MNRSDKPVPGTHVPRGAASTDDSSRSRRGARRLYPHLSVIVGLSLAATACGGVGQKSADSTTEACGPTIKIGAPHPLSGAWAENGQGSVNGMQIAADAINAGGGIKALKGAKLKIVPADTGSTDPSQAAAVTTKLINTDHVVAVVGTYLSNLALTASTSAERAKVPMISQAFVDQLTQRGYKYFFQLPPPSSAIGLAAASQFVDAAKDVGVTLKTAAVTGSNDAGTTAQMNAVSKTAAEKGLKVSETTFFSPGLTDATPIVTKLAANKPDIIFAGGPVGDISLIVRGLRQRGINVPVVGTGGAYVTVGLKTSLGDQINGLAASSVWNDDLKLPGVADASADYRKRFKAPFMPMEAGETWAAVYVLQAAMEESGSCDPQKIRDALASMDITSGNASSMPGGHIKFDSTGLNEHGQVILVQWQDGALRTVWPKDARTTKLQISK